MLRERLLIFTVRLMSSCILTMLFLKKKASFENKLITSVIDKHLAENFNFPHESKYNYDRGFRT